MSKPDEAIATARAASVKNATDDWLKPPPHFKENDVWSRHPQSNQEWNAHSDPIGERTSLAKRRLAFAGDQADPRAPSSMALVSRLDISIVLQRLTWLEARFENTKGSALPPAPGHSPDEAAVTGALVKRAYAMTEPHLSGWRLIIGFEKLDDAQAAHAAIAGARP